MLLPIAALRYVYLAMITVEIIADGMKNDRGPGILYKYRCSKGFEQSSESRETIAHPIPPTTHVMLLPISKPPCMYLAIAVPIIADGMKTDRGPRDFAQESASQ